MANNDNVELQIRAKNLTKEAFAKVSEALKALEDQQQQTTGKGAGYWGKLFATIGGGVAVGNLLSDAFKSVGGMLASIPGRLLELGKRGSDVADLQSSFTALTGAIGESADVMLGKLRSAFGGTITDADLMQSANEALAKGAQLTAGHMDTLAKSARTMADMVGGDAKASFDSMLSAIAKGNEKELRQLPINMANIEKSVKAHASALGVESKELTVSQRQHALRNAVLAEGNRILEQFGETTNDYTDNLAAIDVQVQNFTDSLGVAIATSPVLNEALGSIAESMTGAFGEKQTSVVQTLIGWINKAAITLVDVAQVAVEGARYITFAWSGLKVLFAGLMTVIFTLAEGVNSAFASILEGAAQIPGVGKYYQAAAAEARELATQTTGMRESFQAQVSDAIDGAAAQNAAFDSVGKSLGAMKTRMAEAANQQVSNAAIADALARKNQNLADSNDTVNKETEKVSKAVREMTSSMELASQNGAYELWVLKNAEALKKLATDARIAGVAMGPELARAWQQALVIGMNQDAAKRSAEILKQQEEAIHKAIDRTNERYQKGLAIVADAEAEAGDLRRKRTMSDYDYKVDLLMRQEAAERKQLEALGMATEENLAAVSAKYGEKMAEARQAHNDEMAKMKAATNSWGNLATKWLDSIPGLLQSAFTGGGGFSGAMKGLLSGIGGDVFGKLFSGPNGLGNKVAQGISGLFGKAGLGGKIGSLVGGLGGPIGSILGGLASKGLNKLVGAIFGGSKERKENAAATQQVKEMGNELVKTYGSMENLRTLGKMTGIDIAGSFGHQGKQGLELFTKDIEAFKKKLGEVSQQFNGELSGILGQAEGLGYRLPDTLTPYFDKLREMGVITEENAALLAGFGDSSAVDFKKMEEAAERYGISLDALGGQFNQASINDAARQILEDYDLLKRGGADVGAVIHGMADEVSELAQRSMRLGVSMPENMREIAAHLIANGQLLDENGDKITDINQLSFGDPIKVGLERISGLLETLVKGFGFELPNAMAQVPSDIDVDVNVREHRTRTYEDGDYQTHGGGGEYDVPGSAAGGLFTKPTFRVFAEKQPEVAGSPNAIVDAFAEAMRKTGLGGGGDKLPPITINALDTDSVRRAMRTTLLPELREAILQNRDGIRTELREVLGING